MPKYQSEFLGPLSGPDQTPDDFHQTPGWTIRRLIPLIRRLIPLIRRLGFIIQIWVFDHFLQLPYQTPGDFHQTPDQLDQMPDPLDQTPDALRKGASSKLAPLRADCTPVLFLTVRYSNGVQIRKIRIRWKANWTRFSNLPFPSHLSHAFMVFVVVI